jgi:hypothetical protein
MFYYIVINIYNIKEIIHMFYYIKYVNIVQYMHTIGLLHEYRWILSRAVYHIWTSAIYIFSVFSACTYKNIVHDYFPFKLIGKYLLPQSSQNVPKCYQKPSIDEKQKTMINRKKTWSSTIQKYWTQKTTGLLFSPCTISYIHFRDEKKRNKKIQAKIAMSYC